MTEALTKNGTTETEGQESETGQNTLAPRAKSITTTARQKYLSGKSLESGWTENGTGAATLRTGTLKETEDTVAAPEVPLEQVCCSTLFTLNLELGVQLCTSQCLLFIIVTFVLSAR
jgi:hypothetical protein